MGTERADESKALVALRRAVAQALDRKRRLGQYAVVWRDGRPVRLEAEELGSADGCGMDPAGPGASVREPGRVGGDNGEPRK